MDDMPRTLYRRSGDRQQRKQAGLEFQCAGMQRQKGDAEPCFDKLLDRLVAGKLRGCLELQSLLLEKGLDSNPGARTPLPDKQIGGAKVD